MLCLFELLIGLKNKAGVDSSYLLSWFLLALTGGKDVPFNVRNWQKLKTLKISFLLFAGYILFISCIYR
jgi:hypothetical protein